MVVLVVEVVGGPRPFIYKFGLLIFYILIYITTTFTTKIYIKDIGI